MEATQNNLDLAIAEKLGELAELFRQRGESRTGLPRLSTEWMTAGALAKMLGCSADTVWRRANDGVQVLPNRRVIAQRSSARNTRFAIAEIERPQVEPPEPVYQQRQRLIEGAG